MADASSGQATGGAGGLSNEGAFSFHCRSGFCCCKIAAVNWCILADLATTKLYV
jgi:hypothetical protein